jgi:hypothetical protein
MSHICSTLAGCFCESAGAGSKVVSIAIKLRDYAKDSQRNQQFESDPVSLEPLFIG